MLSECARTLDRCLKDNSQNVVNVFRHDPNPRKVKSAWENWKREPARSLSQIVEKPDAYMAAALIKRLFSKRPLFPADPKLQHLIMTAAKTATLPLYRGVWYFLNDAHRMVADCLALLAYLAKEVVGNRRTRVTFAGIAEELLCLFPRSFKDTELLTKFLENFFTNFGPITGTEIFEVILNILV